MPVETQDHAKTRNAMWRFTDDLGTFQWTNPASFNQLYFPLCNEAGIMSSVTPRLGGDSKTSQHTFLLLPVSIEDLHNNRCTRNFWIHSERTGAYSLTGDSAKQRAEAFTEQDQTVLAVRAGHLWHEVARTDRARGIEARITSFVPVGPETVELMWVKITNLGKEPLTLTPTAAVPIFGRSAENIRDHKHATSLIHRARLIERGVVVKPVIYHDERGHKANDMSYFVVGSDDQGAPPIGQFPAVRDFIGEEGGFDWPRAVVENTPPLPGPPGRIDGLEMVGALRFAEVTLGHGETKGYQILLGSTRDEGSIESIAKAFSTEASFQSALEANADYWRERIDRITFSSGDPNFGKWMRWVVCQPMLRKIFGCSFLPHHDYGKGGRGWRDLWQDSLALLLQQPEGMNVSLANHCCGVRADGTNATIIGAGERQFVADRNNISRVWMDHGVWPYFTTRLYIDQTGDLDILLEEVTYWHDHQTHRAKAVDHTWRPDQGHWARTPTGRVYQGSVLEHFLVQHLTCFFNAGEHNNLRLEDADWNDQLDMAPDRGESVAFSAFYAGNLADMAALLRRLQQDKGLEEVPLANELLLLLDSIDKPVHYGSPGDKRARLGQYFDAVKQGFSGQRARVDIHRLADDLQQKSDWLRAHIKANEWVRVDDDCGFFNGYYNNDGNPVDGVFADGVRMNLTGQAFSTMFGVASEQQVKQGFEACKRYLVDPKTGGFRLTTPLGDNTFNFGRGFALVYGEKETGGMFSHMAVMYANALYRRRFVREGYAVLDSIYQLCNDTSKAHIYPGIPEYISLEGKGMYHYLTGSSSWVVLTMLTQVFGLRGDLGDLIIEPKLVKEQFSQAGEACVSAWFAGRRWTVTYRNPEGLDYQDYVVRDLHVGGKRLAGAEFASDGQSVRIPRQTVEALPPGQQATAISVVLGSHRQPADSLDGGR